MARRGRKSQGINYYIYGISIVVLIALIYIAVIKLNKPKEAYRGEKPAHLVLFYSERCGHCHEAMPAWNKLSGEIAGILYKKIEANDGNWASDYKVSAVPDIRYYPGAMSANDYYVPYNGDRSYESLKKFVLEQKGNY